MGIKYRELNRRGSEIRLLTLHNGDFNDDLRFDIYHSALVEPQAPQRPEQRLPIDELLKTLPEGWTADETEQDRYRVIFEHEESCFTSWDHPDPTIDPLLYKACDEHPPPGFEPSFEALSYTWGSQSEADEALVSHSSPNHTSSEIGDGSEKFSLSTNLAAALRHLRYPDRSRTLWIDAICIDQDNESEKAWQVKRMSLIYRLARRVVVWLGSENEESALAVERLRYIGTQMELGRTNIRYRSPGAIEPMWFRAVHTLPLQPHVWQAIENFFKRPWFERLWIWQEIQLANSRAIVVCGKQEILWQRLRRAINCLCFKDEIPSARLRAKLLQLDPLTRERGSSNSKALLTYGSARKCMDPRDKIYGILSICDKKLAAGIQVRYDNLYTKQDVYKDIALRYLEQTDRLYLLGDFDQVPQDESPSWVTDWSREPFAGDLGGISWTSGRSRAYTKYLAPNALEACGLVVARVSKMSKPAPHDIDGTLKVIRDSEPLGLYEDTYPTGESLLDAYSALLRVNFLSPKYSGYQAPTQAEWKGVFMRHLSSRASHPLDEDGVSRFSEVGWAIGQVKGRSFMMTDNGYLGMGPSNAQPGK